MFFLSSLVGLCLVGHGGLCFLSIELVRLFRCPCDSCCFRFLVDVLVVSFLPCLSLGVAIKVLDFLIHRV